MRVLAALMVLALSALVGLGAATPFATTADVNAKQDASTNLTAVAAGGGIAANWQASGTNSVSIGNATVVSQHGYTGYAVADLPTGVAAGYQTYCTDCITPWGIGDRVEWDGAGWRTLRQKIFATTNYQTYILSCVTNRIRINTPTSDMVYSSLPSNTAAWEFPRSIVQSGGSSQISAYPDAVGVFMQLTAGSPTNAVYMVVGTPSPLTAGNWMSSGGSYYVSAIPDGTTIYWALVGNTANGTAALAITGAYFFFDRYQIYASSNVTCSATWTNNWLAVTASSASYNYTDTGLPVSTSSTAPNRLAVLQTSTGCYFYTNGVLAVADTGITIPGAGTALNPARAELQKTAGGTSPFLGEANPWAHYRRATARSY